MLLELQQAWGHDHFPGELVPVIDHLLSETHLSNIQSEFPDAALSHSLGCYH